MKLHLLFKLMHIGINVGTATTRVKGAAQIFFSLRESQPRCLNFPFDFSHRTDRANSPSVALKNIPNNGSLQSDKLQNEFGESYFGIPVTVNF